MSELSPFFFDSDVERSFSAEKTFGTGCCRAGVIAIVSFGALDLAVQDGVGGTGEHENQLVLADDRRGP